MIVLVTGGRDYDDAEFVRLVLDSVHARKPIATLVHGACGWDVGRRGFSSEDPMQGADRLADDWAVERGILVLRIPANWSLYGPAAGPIRNRQMFAEAPQIDLTIAFPGGRGTRSCVQCSAARKVRVLIANRKTFPTFEAAVAKLR